MQYLLRSKYRYIGQKKKKEEKPVIKTKFTGHRKNVRTRRNILILGMLLCFSNTSKMFAIGVQQTKAMFEKRHLRLTKCKEIENVALQYEVLCYILKAGREALGVFAMCWVNRRSTH